jgi:hypothetical protein
MSAEEAFEAAKAYQSVDNEMGYVDGVPLRLRLPWVLEAIGATKDPARVTLDLVLADGTSQTVELEATPAGPPSHAADLRPRGEEIAANHAATAELPLYLQERDSPIWREHLPEQKLVYVHFGAIANPPGTTLGAFFEELASFVDQRDDADYVVLDMRFNGGGNTGLVLPLVHALVRSEELRIPGRLFVITGRRTFSAAMNTTSLLEIHTPATFVGEPTGSRPNFVGESTWLVLPYHKNRIFCSSRYWQFMSSTDQRKWIAPQLPATLSSQDFALNRDPAMEAVLAAIAAGWPDGSPPPLVEPAGRARVPADD